MNMTMQIELTNDQQQRLTEMAGRLGIKPEELVRVAVVDLVDGPDPAVIRTTERVLQKNAELYRRLAK